MTKLIAKPQPSFPEAVKEGYHRVFDFSGRTRRSDFWWFMLAFIICYFILTNLSKAFLPLMGAAVCDLAVLFFALSITVRRLQDRGASKWWVISSYVALAVYSLYIYGTGIGEELTSINPNPDTIMEAYSDPVFIISLSITMLTGLVTFILCLLDGKPQPNKYGPSPKYIIEEQLKSI